MKPTYTIVSKSHKDWLDSRRGGIGSSEVATLLGLNPYDTPYQLWLRKTGRVKEVENESPEMSRGHILEDGVAQYVSRAAGLSIVKSSSAEFVVVDREKPFFRASPDRYAYPTDAKHTEENRVIIESKTTRGNIKEDEPISDYWLTQVMWQMGVSRTGMAYIGWLSGSLEFGHRPVVYDADFFGFIAEVVERFWTDCVVGGAEPPMSNLSDVLIKYPRQEVGKSVRASDELVSAWAALKDIKAQKKVLETQQAALEETLKMGMLDAETLLLPASAESKEKALATWKAGKPKIVFDMDRFKTDNPELYAKYLTEKEGSRTFLLK